MLITGCAIWLFEQRPKKTSMCWINEQLSLHRMNYPWALSNLNIASASDHGGSVSPQGLVLQGLTWFFSPSHFFPPFLGGGLEQERVRIERPPPQRLSQRDQGLQRDQPPSTTAATYKHENKHRHSIRQCFCMSDNTYIQYTHIYTHTHTHTYTL